MFLEECLYPVPSYYWVFIMLSLFIQDSFKFFRYGAQDNFLLKIRPNILMMSVNFISKFLLNVVDFY